MNCTYNDKQGFYDIMRVESWMSDTVTDISIHKQKGSCDMCSGRNDTLFGLLNTCQWY